VVPFDLRSYMDSIAISRVKRVNSQLN
jgi:hypothetical protein